MAWRNGQAKDQQPGAMSGTKSKEKQGAEGKAGHTLSTAAEELQAALPRDFRMTRQRKVVYEVLLDERDHPTAAEVFDRAKSRMPSISLATVYNCLETLSQAGIVKQVNLDREASRFCPNLRPHAHFFCTACDTIFDIDLRLRADATGAWDVPAGACVDQVDVAMRGLCPDCREKEKAKGTSLASPNGTGGQAMG